MQLNSKNLNELADQACEAAQQAGALIQSYTAGDVAVQRKEGGDSLASQVVTEVDERSQAVILDALGPTRETYDLALLTEELADDGSRFEKDYFWCIDPLDGTLPFTQGKSGYAVSIALVRKDGAPMIGVVYDPVDDRLYRGVTGVGLWIDGVLWEAPTASKGAALKFCMDCTFETDPKRVETTGWLKRLGRELGFDTVQVEVRGGAVCNACYALEHPPAVYLKMPKSKLGGGSFWDFAATACLYQEAGAWVSDASGTELKLNSAEHVFFNHCGVLFSSNDAMANQLLSALKRLPSVL